MVDAHLVMADTDLIACLYPFADGDTSAKEATDVIKADPNNDRYIPQQLTETEQPQHRRRERESTPLEQPRGDVPTYLPYPRLEFRFSHGPQTPYGFVFGHDRNSDVVLDCGIESLSAHHFALAFDDHYRLIVKDLGSFNGTEVMYGDQGEGRRSDFVWIIGGHEVPQKRIVITIHRNLKFHIVVHHHNIASPSYIDKVNRFRQGTVNAESLFGRLDLRSRPQTERASGAHTPGTDPIFIKKKLGEGTFGVVTHLWNVSTADEYALKEPSKRAIREKQVRVDDWRKEAHILSQVSHDHIVTFIDSDFTSRPRLRFEYVPGGTLRNHPDLSTGECLQILRQCLSALMYLHGHTPPIVHRDIKPSNILVRHRHTDNIYVKLGDFGLSREGADPTTICGSPRYLAPEVYMGPDRRELHYGSRSYTPAVDIWSLGVSVLECAYDLPSGRDEGIGWCTEIVTKLAQDLERDRDDLKQFLSDAMVIMEPKQRETARYCYDEVLLLADRSATPTPASQNPIEDEQIIHRQDTNKGTGMSESTSLDDDSAEAWRFIRSNGPPPESVPSTQKRARDSSSSSSRYAKRHAASGQLPPPEVWDALHPRGGGPSLAPLIEQEVSDSNASTTRTSVPRSAQGHVDDGPDAIQRSEAIRPELHPSPERGNASGAQIVAVASINNEDELVANLLIAFSQGE